MNIIEIMQIFTKLNPPIVKEVCYNRKTVFTLVNKEDVRYCNLTSNQAEKLISKYEYTLKYGSGNLTTRWYTFKKLIQ